MGYVSKNENDTFRFAKKFAKKLTGGKVIGLIGDLGAGKTVFAKGLAAGLGVKNTINSPTFVLMKVYPCPTHRNSKISSHKNPEKNSNIKNLKFKIIRFVHVDAYRIKKADELSAIGLGEYFNRPDAVVAIEWADKIKKILPKNTKYIRLQAIIENQRKINA